MTPSSPDRPDPDLEPEPTSPDGHVNPVYEESMRISIADPAAERERRRMWDALRKKSSAQLPAKATR